MSTHSDSGSEDVGMTYEGSGRKQNGSTYDDDICRDYMRNVCTRGKRCRYKHPAEEHSEPPPPPRRDITFCHDYQNNGCTRHNCKFLHCSRDEEEWFHRTGLLPARLNQPLLNNGNGSIHNSSPLCKDFLNGDCKRGNKCRYRHKADKDFDSRGSSGGGGGGGGYGGGGGGGGGGYGGYGGRGDFENGGMICKDYLNGECKRGGKCKYRHVNDHDFDRGGGYRDMKRRRMDDNDYDRIERSDLSFSYLEEENETLKKKVDELKKQVADLTAINEVLLEQNARYRVSKGTAMVPVSQQTLTAVAMAPSPVSATGVAQAPVHPQGTIALTSQQHALQTAQRLAAGGAISLTAQQPPMAAAPSMTPTVTITQNIAGPPMALTQSNMAVSMAQMPQPQLQVAHSLTQNLGAPSTSLVSYPIMSQNMRSAVEHSSLTR